MVKQGGVVQVILEMKISPRQQGRRGCACATEQPQSFCARAVSAMPRCVDGKRIKDSGADYSIRNDAILCCGVGGTPSRAVSVSPCARGRLPKIKSGERKDEAVTIRSVLGWSFTRARVVLHRRAVSESVGGIFHPMRQNPASREPFYGAFFVTPRAWLPLILLSF